MQNTLKMAAATALLALLGGCDEFAEQTPPMARTDPDYRQEYFDALNHVPTHTGENLTYTDRARIYNEPHGR